MAHLKVRHVTSVASNECERKFLNILFLSAFMADSCRYYKNKLAATKDGIYMVYPNGAKQLVHCVGLRNRNGVKQFPIRSPG